MDLTPGRHVDRYVIEALVGRGATATVWRARHVQLGTPWAIKLLHVTSRERQERLLLEGRIQSGLRHPNVVRVFDVIEVDGALALVLELVDGPTLEQWLQSHRATIAQADVLARGVLAGVAAAHAAGSVHRDLKPGNILLQPTADGPVPKVADFGLAKVLEADVRAGLATRPGVAMGTPCYMAPEQVRDTAHVDARADLFALGGILYEILAGRRAFDGPDTMRIFEQITRGVFTPLGEIVPDAPERMARAVEAALRVDPAERPADAQALLALWTEGLPSLPLDAPWEVISSLPAGAGEPSIGHETFRLDRTPGAPPVASPPPARARWAGPLLAVGGAVAVVATGLLATGDPAHERRWSDEETAHRQCARALDDVLRGELRVAERSARACTELDPASASAHLLLGGVLNLRGFDAESLAATRRARLAAGPDHPDGELVRLVAETGSEQAWEAWLAAHPADTFGHVLWAAGTPESLFSRDDSARWEVLCARGPEVTLAWVQRARRLIEAHRLAEAGAVIEDGLAVDPSSTALGHVRARWLVALGRLQEAAAVLSEVLVRDPAFAEARLLLAQALDLAGRGEARDQQLARLLSDETALADRIRAARSYGPHLMGMGRDEAAFDLLERCVTWSEGMLSERFACVEIGLRMANWTEDGDRIASWLDRHERALAMPEFPAEEREASSRFALRMQVSLALRRGEVGRARELVGRYDALPGPDGRLYMHADLEAAEGDARALVAAYPGELDGTCQDLGRRGALLARSGATAEALAALRRAVHPETHCERLEWDRYVVARAHVELAALLTGTDPAEAGRHVEAFRALWPDPDPDHPLVQRVLGASP